MARRVFFSFHFDRDIWRANVVRNSWVTHDDREEAGYWDASLWEEAKKSGDTAIRRMIDNGLEGTSVTAVLIGFETSGREWVQYEIKKSYERGNGLIGVYIHNVKDRFGRSDRVGQNPFGRIYTEQSNRKRYFSDLYPTYDWINDNGYSNIAKWIEDAARKAGR